MKLFALALAAACFVAAPALAYSEDRVEKYCGHTAICIFKVSNEDKIVCKKSGFDIQLLNRPGFSEKIYITDIIGDLTSNDITCSVQDGPGVINIHYEKNPATARFTIQAAGLQAAWGGDDKRINSIAPESWKGQVNDNAQADLYMRLFIRRAPK